MAQLRETIAEEEISVSVPEALPGSTAETSISLEVVLVAAAVALTLVAALVSGQVRSIDLLLPAGVVLMLVLSYVEGTNSVSESVATLVGSELASYRRALAWGAVWTVVGSAAAALIATALVRTFTSGIMPRGAHPTEALSLAVLGGTAIWMVAATRLEMPVASTHAIVGGLVAGAMLVYGAGDVRWGRLIEKVGIPIVISPVIAAVLAVLLYLVVSRSMGHFSPAVHRGLHWLSSAAASFARGLNQGPKIAALGTLLLVSTGHTTATFTPLWVFLLVGLGMGVGSFLGGKRVTRTLAEKVTNMDEDEALSANLVTAVTVGVASDFGLPVSNAEVGSGAIMGVGLHEGHGRVNWSSVRSMMLAWLVTAPVTGILSLILYVAIRLLHLGHV